MTANGRGIAFRKCTWVAIGGLLLALAACDTAPKPARQDAHGYTEVHHAAMDGDLDAVRKYLAEGISPNITDVDGVTPLHRAARDGNMELARLLVQYHADVNMRTQEDWDALQFAAWHSHNDIVELLLGQGAVANRKLGDGWNMFHVAAMKGNAELVRVAYFGTSRPVNPVERERVERFSASSEFGARAVGPQGVGGWMC